MLHIQYNQSMSEVILTQNKIHGRIPEWPKGTDCKSAANCFDGSNPSPSICRSGGTGRRPGLKIPWVVIPVPVRFRSAAFFAICIYRKTTEKHCKIKVFSRFLFFYAGTERQNPAPFLPLQNQMIFACLIWSLSRSVSFSVTCK